jgi:hypothetical protein
VKSDRNKVWMKYPDSSFSDSAKSWISIHSKPERDPQIETNMFDGDTYVNREGQGWVANVRPNNAGQVKMRVYSMDKNKLTDKKKVDQARWRSQGFIYSTQDWRNIEITSFIRGQFESFCYSCRGITSDLSEKDDEGLYCYKCYIFQNGVAFFIKENFDKMCTNESELQDDHVIDKVDISEHLSDDEWIGIKFIVIDKQDTTLLQLYINRNTIDADLIRSKLGTLESDWKLILEKNSGDENLRYGGPIVSLGWSKSNWVWFKSASVREIRPSPNA